MNKVAISFVLLFAFSCCLFAEDKKVQTAIYEDEFLKYEKDATTGKVLNVTAKSDFYVFMGFREKEDITGFGEFKIALDEDRRSINLQRGWYGRKGGSTLIFLGVYDSKTRTPIKIYHL